MALVDLKSKLNEFGENNPDNPYQKGNKISDLENSPTPDIDKDKYLETGEQPESDLTKLNSRYDRENTPDSVIVREKTKKSSAKEFVKDFGLSSFDVPTSDNYEDNIKKENIDGFSDVTRTVKRIEKTIKGAKDILKGKVSKGIKGITEGQQDEKLSAYRAKAYGRIKHLGEQGRKVSNVDGRTSEKIFGVGNEGRSPKEFEGPIKGGLKSKNVNRANIALYGSKAKGKDLVPFRFKDVYNNKYITFSAILSGITDTITPEYAEEKFIGRPDNVYIYKGATRAIGFTFDVYPTTRQELPVLWEKVNYLVGLCYPNWAETPTPIYKDTSEYNPLQMVSPITQLTIGDMYKDTPGFLSSVTVTVQDGTTWEFEKELELPHHIQIACEFTYIGKYLPNATGKHFELNWITDKDPTEDRVNLREFFSPGEREKRLTNRAATAGKRGNIGRQTRLSDKATAQWEKSLGLDDDGSGLELTNE